MVWLTSSLASLTDMLVYTGLHEEEVGLKNSSSNYLDHLEPEVSPENESVLARPLSWRPEDKDREADYSLTGNLSIPSHEEVENDSLVNLLEFEHGLQPPPGVAAAESEEDEENDVSEKMRDYNDSDTEDSLEMELEQSTRARAGASTTTTAAAAGNLVTESLSSIFSSILTSNLETSSSSAVQKRRTSDLEDFELISEDDLEDEQI